MTARPGTVLDPESFQGLGGIAGCLVPPGHHPDRPIHPGKDQTDGHSDHRDYDQEDKNPLQGRRGPEPGTAGGPSPTPVSSGEPTGHLYAYLPLVTSASRPSGVGVGPRVVTGPNRPVQGIDCSTLLLGQGESEQVQILLLPLGMDGLGDDDGPVLDVPPQHNLGR